MDKALKQRLVGATVLIALAVIVLPMLLSGPQRGTGTQQPQSIELPPRPDEVTFETRRFPLGETEPPPGAEVADAAPTARLPLPEATAPEPAAGVSGDSAKGDPEENVSPEKTDEPGAPGVQPLPSVEIEPAPRVDIRPEEPAPAATPEPESGTGTAPASGRYVVQVASLGSGANARKLMSTLQQAGLPVLMDTVESDVGRLNRVRVGPFGSEADANAAVRRVGDLVDGVSPRVVDLRPDDGGPVASSADPMVRWVVQVGSFSEADNAEGLVRQLRADGLTAYRETVRSSGSSIHRVRVGPFLDRQDALSARQNIIDAHALEGVVLSAD